MRWVLVCLLLMLVLGCSRKAQTGGSTFSVRRANLVFPYVASKERRDRIENGVQRISVGMSAKELQEILGEPDEIHELVDKQKKNSRIIGTTYWYFFEKAEPEDDVNASLIRVTLDVNDRVVRTDRWEKWW